MISPTTFENAALALSEATSPDADLCGPFLSVLGVTGAAVTTLGNALGSETVTASDARAASFNELQLDLGEGPCWEAVATHHPVLESDLQHNTNASWPLAWQALSEAGVGAVFAFPLAVAGADIGAIGLYSDTPTSLSAQEKFEVRALSTILARQVMRRRMVATAHEGDDAGRWEGDYSRREVHQATGMVLAQMSLSAADALMILQGHAFATSRPVRDVARDVIARLIDFTPSTDERN